MGLVVDLGLERFFYGKPPEDRVNVLEALIETGYCTMVREVATENGRVVSPGTPVFEARRTGQSIVTRTLDAAEAKPILDEVREVFADTGSYASFSWDQLEELGGHDVHNLAIDFDGGDEWAQFDLRIAGERQRVISLDRSQLNFTRGAPLCEAAWAFHWLARRHRLVVHCA
ncbi:MAG: hypothetical protein AAGA54_10265 [Myxococcota bacterium]